MIVCVWTTAAVAVWNANVRTSQTQKAHNNKKE